MREGVAWARFSTCRRSFSSSILRASAWALSSAMNRRRDSYWLCTRYSALSTMATSRTRLRRVTRAAPRSRRRLPRRARAGARRSCHLRALGHPHDGAAGARVAGHLGLAGLDAVQGLELHGLGRGKGGTAVVHLFGVLVHELFDDAVFQRLHADLRQAPAGCQYRQRGLSRLLQIFKLGVDDIFKGLKCARWTVLA